MVAQDLSYSFHTFPDFVLYRHPQSSKSKSPFALGLDFPLSRKGFKKLKGVEFFYFRRFHFGISPRSFYETPALTN